MIDRLCNAAELMKCDAYHHFLAEAIAQRAWPRHAADPVSVAVLLYCYSRSVHTFWYCHMLDRRMSSDRMRAMAAPLHFYRWSRIDVAIAHSLLEQHSSLGSSASG